MKNYKKILVKLLVLVFLAGFILPVLPDKVRAATDWAKFWGSCAQSVVVGFGINCNLEDSNAKFTYATYSSAAPFVTATYQASYVDSPTKTPEIITIVDSTTKKPIDPTPSALQTSRFKYASLTGTSKTVDDDGKQIKYLVYRPMSGNQDFTLLVRDQDSKLRVLALVHNKVIEKGSGDFVYAWKINKATIGSTQTGAPVANPDDPDEKTISSCEEGSDNSFVELNWMFCPILRGLDGMFTGLNKIVEKQLNFCTGASDSAGGQYCETNNTLLTNEVKQAWSIFRLIATSLLVIIMLVMVFSQAINAGIFDNYTIKKMLPRLVVAAILIQLSWYVFKFAVDLSNDAGHGIASLMYLPFGGEGKMSFDNLIGNVGSGAVGVASAGLLTAIVVAGIFSAITIGGILLLGVSAVLGLIIAVLVLLFREILIILLMIMVPIALIAWILPGTQKYWKLWQDNFTKLLLMFPLIMGMIAAGRIFAFVGGRTDGTDGIASIIGLMIVFVGFFGPYYFLPKTFNWGGQMFGALANGAWNGSKRYRNAPGKYALERAKENRGQRDLDRLARLAEDRSPHRRWDEFLAGRNNFALSRGTRERHFEINRAKGREEAEKAHQAAVVGSAYEQLDHGYKLEDLTDRAQGRRGRHTGIDGSNPAAARHALDELAKYGDWDIISNLRDNGNIDERTWQSFLAKNISAVHQNVPHLSPQRTDLSEQAIEDRTTYKDFEMEELLRQAREGEIRDAATGASVSITDPEEILAHRLRHVSKAQAVLGDEQLRRRLTERGLQIHEEIARLNETDPLPIPTLNVSNAGGRGASTQVILPTSLGTPEARQSLTQNMAIPRGTPPNEAQAQRQVRNALINRVAAAPAGSTDETEFVNYMSELRDQASTSPEAKTLYNQLVDDMSVRLSSDLDNTEHEMLIAGHDSEEIDRTVIDSLHRGNEKLDRLNLPKI